MTWTLAAVFVGAHALPQAPNALSPRDIDALFREAERLRRQERQLADTFAPALRRQALLNEQLKALSDEAVGHAAKARAHRHACDGRNWSLPPHRDCGATRDALTAARAEAARRMNDYETAVRANQAELQAYEAQRKAIAARATQVDTALSRVEGLTAVAGCPRSSADAHVDCLRRAWDALTPYRDCVALQRQLDRDLEAMRRQLGEIGRGNAELAKWAKENDAAQQAALKHATYFLVDALTAKLGEVARARIQSVVQQLQERAPAGRTYARLLERARELQALDARLSAANDAIKFAEFPGAAATDAWLELRDWAERAGRDGDTIDAILAEFRKDPDLRHILVESGLSAGASGIRTLLRPLLAGLTSPLEFLANYGYDWSAWMASRRRIIEQEKLRETDLAAVDALRTQIERTVSRLAACRAAHDRPALASLTAVRPGRP